MNRNEAVEKNRTDGIARVGNLTSVQRSSKLPRWAILLTILLALGLVAKVLKTDDASSPANTDAKQAETPPKQPAIQTDSDGLTAADKYALQLTHNFRTNGYDISAFVFHRELRLESDLFRDAYTRESQVTALTNEKKTLCDLDIWYIKVGYSKGILSSNIMKNVNLGCPAEKLARVQELASERDKAASELSVRGMHATAQDTTMIFESDFFSDSALRSQFVTKFVKNDDHMRRLCNLEFYEAELRYQGRIVQTVPLSCK